MSHKIKDGAIFISDAHENSKRDDFYHFLLQLESKKIQTSQLFLMGDIFDLLIGEISYLRNRYKKEIDLIEKIAQDVEIFYFEGNHDFSLKSIFKNVKIIDINSQPSIFKIGDKKILLLHGDKYGDLKHNIFTSAIRSKFLLMFLNFFDKICTSCISKKISTVLERKNICTKIDNFQVMISEKISQYYKQDTEFIGEGHYHQDEVFSIKGTKYINFPSFACNQSYIIVQLSPDIKFLPIHLS
ncbi:MAG: UDP-2,3-diacylglucosamine diphosphatase [Epsilonproteobacteria bacterium]|nr:UDP-2,3-diacylglucosamine diphosphatase [Campylobacterota bacterium]